MKLSTTVKCEFCNCNEMKCLGQCQLTKKYFCNGSSGCKESHLLHYLRETKQTKFDLLPANSFAGIPFSCYNCGEDDIFKIGFVQTLQRDKIYIVCKEKCLSNPNMNRYGINQRTFEPLVEKDYINYNILNKPDPNRWKNVTIAKIKAKLDQVKNELGFEGDKPVNELPVAKDQYQNEKEYVACMNHLALSESLDDYYNILNVEFIKPNKIKFQIMKKHFSKQKITFSQKFRKGIKVKFAEPQKIKQGFFTASIINVEQNVFTAQFDKQPPFFNNESNKKVRIKVITEEEEFQRNTQRKSLKNFSQMNSVFKQAFLCNFSRNFERENKPSKLIRIQYPPKGLVRLNESQVEAVKNALSHKFSTIQGPPGTGKTTVLVEIAYSLCRARIKPLICAATNVAVDQATLKLADLGLKPARALSFTYSNEIVDKRVLKYAVDFSGISTQSEINEALEIEQQNIKEADVVLTTCTVAASRLSNISFQAILFDEAAQLTDLDLICGCDHQPAMVCLIGDHKQLGPVLSNVSIKAKYDVSLLERLVRNGFKPSLLRYQYRMHPSISLLPSSMFHNKLVVDGVFHKDRNFHNFSYNYWPNNYHPLLLWNSEGQEQNDTESRSFSNPEECSKCVQIVESLISTSKVKIQQIGIITPYASQEQLIKNTIHQKFGKRFKNIHKLEISSVDGFQGREKDFIILSFVRSNSENDIGFTNDDRRLCVQMSRAKYGLFILMNIHTYKHDPKVKEIISYYINKGAAVQGKRISKKKKINRLILNE
ncbi:regulator of nonsense transcripts 1 [Tritrichomonas foetus]|uniref:Regulator of nonsense transcripts 1 n=1 Tax=Tritrichomonas foetus TaxID=1144522 RepID=A0A1J4JZK3_9EUKA|nr:regulator of nonsense transcripts 1 [Tritrichomonas foetus]|eukprot:OHT04411.1 regulator of nonsense transcripts 1 [Tritrichomonas foetus]